MENTILLEHLQQSKNQPLSLGQYRLLEEVGRGGMGRVYRALHTIMGREVALKVISPELVSDPIAVEWFLREVRASTQLNHPNIVMAYDANQADGLHFLVMEYVQGRTLDAVVKQQGPLPIAYACDLMRQAALALQHAHEKGMVHRDIKPGNLLIPIQKDDSPSDVMVKILDFGLARLHDKKNGDTIAVREVAGLLGTPDYIAPEQSRDIHAADIRSDLYSLGCVFYFALSGRVPFPGDSAMEKLIKHLMDEPEPLEKVRAEIPPALAAIVHRLMAKEPADRYQTPSELMRELEKQRAGSVSDGQSVANASGSLSDPQPQHTRLLDNVEIFEQLGDDPHDTLTSSPPEETEEVTVDGIDAGAIPPVPFRSPRLDSDRTILEVAAPDTMLTDPPSTAPLPPIDPVVLSLWGRWVGLLETIVAGRGPGRVNDDAYQTVHTLLLQACRAAVDACPVPERRAFYEECLSIAQPWFKLQAFVHADATMLSSLLQRAHEIEVELNGGKAPWTLHQVIALALLVVSSAAAALWYLNYGRIWLPSLFRAFQGNFSLASLRAAWDFLLSHPALMMGVLFPLLILFSVVQLSRS